MGVAQLLLDTACGAGSGGWDTSVELPGWMPAAHWPSARAWIGHARGNALRLFPAECYLAARCDHRVAGRRLVVLNDPSSVQHVLGRGAGGYRLANLHKRMLKPAFRRGLIVAEGEDWVRQRRQAHRFATVAARLPADTGIGSRIDQVIDRWLGSRRIDPADDLTILSMELVALMVFRHADRLPRTRLLDAVAKHRASIERVGLLDVAGAPWWLRTTRLSRAARIAASFDRDIEAAVASLVPSTAANDEIDRDFVVSMLSGFESVSALALWTLGVLGHAPDLQAALRSEGAAGSLEPGSPDRGATSMLDATVLETMRLYPPLPMIFRTATSDDHTPAGLVARGSLVCLSPWLVHRNPRWWDDPLAFRPGRHLGQAMLPPHFMAFGTGVRRCVGARLGRFLLAEIVSRVLARCTIRACAPLPLPRAGVTLRPDRPLSLMVEAYSRG